MNLIIKVNPFRKTIISLFLVFICSSVYAQRGEFLNKSLTPESSADKPFSFPEIVGYDGTYQFILSEKKNISIHNNILERIERSRKEDEDTLLKLSKFCEVLILSKKKIKSANFKKFETSHILR